MLLNRLGHYLRHNLWLVPLLCVLCGSGLALVTSAIGAPKQAQNTLKRYQNGVLSSWMRVRKGHEKVFNSLGRF
jgi:hypothetical protein